MAVVFLFAFAFSIRTSILIFFGRSTPPFSDFEWAHVSALGSEEYIPRYRIYPSWGFFSILLKKLYDIVFPSYYVAQFFNAVLSSFSVALLYVIAYKVIKSKGIALIVGAFFALYPPNIFYTVILSPEFPAIFLVCLVILLVVYSFNHEILYPVLLRVASWRPFFHVMAIPR